MRALYASGSSALLVSESNRTSGLEGVEHPLAQARAVRRRRFALGVVGVLMDAAGA
jgi:hypothetical protein